MKWLGIPEFHYQIFKQAQSKQMCNVRACVRAWVCVCVFYTLPCGSWSSWSHPWHTWWIAPNDPSSFLFFGDPILGYSKSRYRKHLLDFWYVKICKDPRKPKDL